MPRIVASKTLLCRVPGAGPLPPHQRQPVRTRARAVLPLRHPPLPHSPASRRRHACARFPSPDTPTCSKRRFEEAIDLFLAAQAERGPSAAISSALAAGYKSLAFQTLADQVRRSVRSVRGNQWMFRAGHPADYPLRVRPELLAGAPVFPILRETTPVRMDLTHSGWSDIFFLGMDFPEGARVLNISIDLAVRSASAPDGAPKPPVEAYFRVIDQPVLRLTSVDLQASADVTIDRRSLRFRARLSRPVEGRRDRQRHRASRHGRRHPAALRAARAAHRQARARHRNRQQGERHSEGLAPGRLHQSAGLPDRGVHARHQPDPRAHRLARGTRPPPGGRARDSRRMARRQRRRLAGFRRRLARHQVDPRRQGRRGRSGIRHQPRTPAAQPRDLHHRPGSAIDARESCSRAWCWCTAAWRRTSAPSWKW